MATKTQKQNSNIQETLRKAYIDYVLTHEKDPASVYSFAKALSLPEADFYKHFNSFSDIENDIWLNAAKNTIDSLKASKAYQDYSSREKILGFFYTLIECLNQNRSYYVYSLKKRNLLLHPLTVLRSEISAFAKEVIQEGLSSNELMDRKLLSEKYHEAVWLNTTFILKFWTDDTSHGFEKTDAAIEKTVNLMLELMGKSALDGMLDLGKFLMQNGRANGFKF